MGWASRANLNRAMPPRAAKTRDVSEREAAWLARWYAMWDRVHGMPVLLTRKEQDRIIAHGAQRIADARDAKALAWARGTRAT